jgi:hypothetical protein
METNTVPIEKKSFFQKTKDYLGNKKTQLLGATILASSMAIAGCGPLSLEKKVFTPDSFDRGRLTTVTGEVLEGYKDESLRGDLNIPLVVYNSVDEAGNNLLVNIHEDFRHGINTQAIKRIKEGLNSHDYAIRVYGRTTLDNIIYEINNKKKPVINIDAYFITLTDKKGDIKLTLGTDIDPINTLPMAANLIIPINPNPGLSFGLEPYLLGGWQPFDSSGWFDSMNWFNWISTWGIGGGPFSITLLGMNLARGDFDHDGIPNYFDPNPYMNDRTGEFVNNDPRLGNFQNAYAGLNLHNALSENAGEKKLVVPTGQVKLHPDFVNIFAHNREVDGYRQQVLNAEKEIGKNYQANPAKAGSKEAQPRVPLEQITQRLGIRPGQLERSYNNERVRAPGAVYARNFSEGGTGVGGRVVSGGSNYVNPGSVSTSPTSVTTPSHSTNRETNKTSSGSEGGKIKN